MVSGRGRAALAAALLVGAVPACAQDILGGLTLDDVRPPDLDEQMAEHLPSLAEITSPERMQVYEEVAREIAVTSSAEALAELRRIGEEMGVVEPEGAEERQGIVKLPDRYRATVLVSTAMGWEALRDVLQRHAGRGDMRFAFRGVPADMTVPEFALALQELGMSVEGDAAVELMIDPEAFERSGVGVAPTVLIEDLEAPRDVSGPMTGLAMASPGHDLGAVVMIARGLHDPDTTFDAFRKGHDSYEGPMAVAVSEEDLRVRAEREARAKLETLTRDPEVLRDRFWARQRDGLDMMGLIPAYETRERQLHFAYVAPEDITDHEGRILARRGQVFQPTDVLPWNRRVFVIDARRPEEIEHVERALATPRHGVMRTVIVVAGIPDPGPDEDPWQPVQDLVDRFGIHVFVLNDHFRTSFQVERTPTEIFPREGEWGVDVIALEEPV